MLGYYIGEDGNMFGEDDSLVDPSVITDEFGFPVGVDDSDETDIKLYK